MKGTSMSFKLFSELHAAPNKDTPDDGAKNAPAEPPAAQPDKEQGDVAPAPKP